MKTKKYADGGLAGIADTANSLMNNVSDMANTINYGSGNTGGATNPLGFSAIAGQSSTFKKGGSVKRYESGGSTSAEAPKFDGFPKSEKAVEEFKETMQRLREKGKEVGEAVRSTRGAGSARGALGSSGPKNLGGKIPEMKKGGSVKGYSIDGIAKRGKTRAKLKGR